MNNGKLWLFHVTFKMCVRIFYHSFLIPAECFMWLSKNVNSLPVGACMHPKWHSPIKQKCFFSLLFCMIYQHVIIYLILKCRILSGEIVSSVRRMSFASNGAQNRFHGAPKHSIWKKREKKIKSFVQMFMATCCSIHYRSFYQLLLLPFFKMKLHEMSV